MSDQQQDITLTDDYKDLESRKKLMRKILDESAKPVQRHGGFSCASSAWPGFVSQVTAASDALCNIIQTQHIMKFGQVPPAWLAQAIAANTASTKPTNPTTQVFKLPDNIAIGDTVAGQGIYFGIFEPRDIQYGLRLNKRYYEFAAPTDLNPGYQSDGYPKYNQTVEQVAGLEDYHGHCGMHCESAMHLYRVFDDDTYNGAGVIPPSEVLSGRNAHGNIVHADSLYRAKDKGMFATSSQFVTHPAAGSDASTYFSCTEDMNGIDAVFVCEFGGAFTYSAPKSRQRANCRVVRFVPVPEL
jgi:hypothetical protein